ncbi:phosphomevalonate kinase [Virgibacillus pantothenticus]|nr:phosphomevalonate kinase [Virgibacillus pantothenticus]MED3735399.1 phosphomevalonate kinase [Virgibacillus pantothenticus]QTY16687.1 phosphomevalonate kinase [Virgibacillus pantothenticus]
MSQSTMNIKVPGKLMVAGEFAVLQPYQHLVVMAVDRFVYANIKDSTNNSLHLLDFKLENIGWEYKADKVELFSTDPRTAFVQAAMTTALQYLREQQYAVTPFQLAIKSELDDESGVKYGLGSSAAVSTSVIAAILNKFMPETPEAKLIYQLASIAHVVTQGNGSGADVAASSFGGFLNYSSFQAEWLREAYKKSHSLTELTRKDWVYASLDPITLPNSVHVCIGWTGKPASTKKLVDQILQLKITSPEKFASFISHSEQAVKKVLQGMKQNNLELLLQGIKDNRHALATVGEDANVAIETPLLTTLCDLAEEFGGAGKPSGAGGGDCGIAFMSSKEAAEALMEAWEKAGIKPLALQPHPHGAMVSEAKDM